MKKTVIILLTAILAGPALAGNTLVSLDTNRGEILLRLYDDTAPITVANFLSYVTSGFYEGLIFHRTMPEFMVQGGAYDVDLYDADFSASPFDPNDPAYYHPPNSPIVLEVTAGHSNLRGTVAMARNSDPISATSQFYINLVDNTHLDSTGPGTGYAVFGEVISDMYVPDAIGYTYYANRNAYFSRLPYLPTIIESASVVQCETIPEGDLNGDCYVNMLDVAIIAANWLKCTDAGNVQCTP
jgi:cyclophilin family peptidyl-prolyl cis-trans isomerase